MSPLYAYVCRSCGEAFEKRRSIAKRATGRHTCGGEGEQVFTPNLNFHIAMNQHPATQVSWEQVAPLDAEGIPLGRREAAKVVEPYDPTLVETERAHHEAQRPRLEKARREKAKRTAFREVSRRRRIEVKS